MIVLLPKPTVRWTPTEDDDSMLASYNRGDTSNLDVLNRDTEDSGKYLFFFFIFDNSNVQTIKSTNTKIISGALWAFKPSTKNFTLLWNGRQRVMAFGKVAKDQFRIMMKHPFSYVQAFELCVSACVAKIA